MERVRGSIPLSSTRQPQVTDLRLFSFFGRERPGSNLGSNCAELFLPRATSNAHRACFPRRCQAESEVVRPSAQPLAAMRSRTNCSSCSIGNRTLRPMWTGVSAPCHISSYRVVRLTQSIIIAWGMLTRSGRTDTADVPARSTVLFEEAMPDGGLVMSPISTRVRCSAGVWLRRGVSARARLPVVGRGGRGAQPPG
jgi:hypothetical protein